MTPQWISIALAVLVQTATIAFVLGGVIRDVKALKEDAKKHDTTRDEVVGVSADLKHIQRSIENIERNMQGVQRQLANAFTVGKFSGPAE